MLSFLPHRVTSDINTKLLENLTVNLRQHHSGMHLSPLQLRQLLKRQTATLVTRRKGRKHYKNLVSVQTRIAPFQVIHLCMLYRLYQILWDKLHLFLHSCKIFH